MLSKHLGIECVCEEQQPGSPNEANMEGKLCDLNAKLKSTYFFQHPPPFRMQIVVQLKLQQFKHFWEYIELMGDAIRQHFAEISRHKNSLSR